MEVSYYHITDLNRTGKEEDYVPYLYDPQNGWAVDRSNILSDRLFGYDGDQIGSTDMQDRIKEITQTEAEELINAL